jgi:hypothetical protein
MAQKEFKSNSVIKSEWFGSLLKIDFRLGGTIQFDANSLSDENKLEAMKKGILEKISNAGAIKAPTRAAGMGNEEWTKVWVEYLRQRWQEMVEQAEYLRQGDVPWNRTAGGGQESLLLPALCRLKPALTVAQVAEFIKTRTKEQLDKLKARADVLEEQAKIRAERAAAKVTEKDLQAVNDGWDELEEMGG